MKGGITDKEGKFTIAEAMPGVPMYVNIRKGQSFYVANPRIGALEVKSGESLDLGDRRVELMR